MTVVRVDLNVEVDTSGNITVFGQGPSGEITNPIYPSVTLPATCLYDPSGFSNNGVSNSLIEFWEPSDSLGNITAILSGSDSSLASNSRDYTKFTKKFARDLQAILEGSFDASGADPFNVTNDDGVTKKYTDSNYYSANNFGRLALSAYAHYLFGHVAATAAITNDTEFIRSILSWTSNDAYMYTNTTSIPDVSGTLWGDSSASASNANLAMRLIYKLITHSNTDITNIAKQVIGQDASRAMGEDNNQLDPDMRSPLRFYAGDTIYMNIKLKRPEVIYSPHTNGNPLNASSLFTQDINYTLCITLSNDTGFDFPISVITDSVRQYVTNGDNININPFAGVSSSVLNGANFIIPYTRVFGYINELGLSNIGLLFNSSTGEISGTLTSDIQDAYTIVQAKNSSNILLAESIVALNDTGSTLNLGGVSPIIPFYLKDASTNTTGYSSRTIDSVTDIILDLSDSSIITTYNITNISPRGSYEYGYNTINNQLIILGSQFTNVGKYIIIIDAIKTSGGGKALGSDSTELIASTTYVIEITDITSTPLIITLNQDNVSLRAGTDISGSNIVVSANTSGIDYSTSPLPNWLSINASGKLIGAPQLTDISGTTVYTITGTEGGRTASTQITIRVDEPIFRYNISEVTTVINANMPINSPTYNPKGFSSVSYDISGGVLPLGITLNSATGILSGQFTQVYGYNYVMIRRTIIDTNDVSSVSITGINFRVDASTSLSLSLYKNIAITPIQLTAPGYESIDIKDTSGNTLSLPSGLSIDSSGFLIATPTSELSSTIYVGYLYRNKYIYDASSNTIIQQVVLENISRFSVSINIAAPNLDGNSNTYIFNRGTTITPINIINSGGDVTSYTVEPTLPEGLTIDLSGFNAVISGTPTTAQSATNYTITANGVISGYNNTCVINLTINSIRPSLSNYTNNSQTITYGSAMTPMTVTNSGDTATFDISPSLPIGLTINSSTGTISGTLYGVESASSSTVEYIITASNNAGSVIQPVYITTQPRAPNITRSVASVTGTVDSPITPITFTNSGGPISSYDISGSLPTGLNIDISGGIIIISGTPTVTSANTTYTITATNGNDTSTTTVNIAINAIQSTRNFVDWFDGTGNQNIARLAVDASGTSYVYGTVPSSGTVTDPNGLVILDASGVITPYTKQANTGIAIFISKIDSSGNNITSSIAYDINGNETIRDMVISQDGFNYTTFSTTQIAATPFQVHIFEKVNISTGLLVFRNAIYDITGGLSGTDAISKGVISKSITYDVSSNTISAFETISSSLIRNSVDISTGALGTGTVISSGMGQRDTSGNYLGALIKYNSANEYVNGIWLALSSSSSSTGCAINKIFAHPTIPNLVYVVGQATNAFSGTRVNTGSTPDGFLAAVNLSDASGGVLSWVTWIGTSGSSTNAIFGGISLDGSQITVAYTQGTNGYVANYNSSGTLQGSAYNLASSGTVIPSMLTLDTNKNIYVTGTTTHTLSANSYCDNTKTTTDGNNSQFVLKLNSSLVPQWGTYINGNGAFTTTVNNARGISVLGNSIYVLGATNSNLSLTAAPVKPSGGGNHGTYLIKYTI